MEKLYIGRIKLSKEDSKEWEGNPTFMYVTDKPDRSNINNATLFDDRLKCFNETIKSFKKHRHLPESKMQIMEFSLKINSIKDI